MSCKIYVGNLAWATDDEALGQHFTRVGTVKGAQVMKSEGRSRGFGFVTFSSTQEAERAISTMNDSELHGRRLRVNVASQQFRTTPNHSSDLSPVRTGYAQPYHVPPYPMNGVPYIHPSFPHQHHPSGFHPSQQPYPLAPSPYRHAPPGSFVPMHSPSNSSAYPVPPGNHSGPGFPTDSGSGFPMDGPQAQVPPSLQQTQQFYQSQSAQFPYPTPAGFHQPY